MELSVNLSVAQLADPELEGQLGDVLTQTGMPAELLELELTESHLMDNPAAAQAKVAALKAALVRLHAEVFHRPLVFPQDVRAYPAFVQNQSELYQRRQAALRSSSRRSRETTKATPRSRSLRWSWPS